jgi:hypothetical protein
MQMLQIAVRAALDAARCWMNVMNARHGARNFMPNTFSTDEGMHDFFPPDFYVDTLGQSLLP